MTSLLYLAMIDVLRQIPELKLRQQVITEKAQRAVEKDFCPHGENMAS